MEENNTLVAILSEAMRSTVDADNSASKEYFRELERIGISSNGEGSKLETVECVVKGKDEKEYVLKIPKLILMPMPLLHIKEATFDVEGEWEIIENAESYKEESRNNLLNDIVDTIVEEEKPSSNNVNQAKNDIRSQLMALNTSELRQAIQVRNISSAAQRRVLDRVDTIESLDRVKPTIALVRSNVISKPAAASAVAASAASKSDDSKSGSTSSQSSSSSQSSKNQSMKIRMSIKMEQSDMPVGLSNLIQTVNNCIEVKEPVKKN